MTRMTLNDIEALEVMVEVFGTQQLLDALEAIAISKVLYSGRAPLNSVQAHIERDERAGRRRKADAMVKWLREEVERGAKP